MATTATMVTTVMMARTVTRGMMAMMATTVTMATMVITATMMSNVNKDNEDKVIITMTTTMEGNGRR